MAESASRLSVAIDTASDVTGVAILDDAVLVAETTWLSRRNQSRELLPALDSLLVRAGRDKHQIGAICVCLGPGSYAGVRVGLSTAKALAFGLNVPLVGIGRLAAEALPMAEITGRRVIPLQAAGRAELAFAAYVDQSGDLSELISPRLAQVPAILETVEAGDVVCGDIAHLDAQTVAEMESAGCRLAATALPRAVSVARLGLRRLARGEIDNPDTLVPLYLREPAIGPQS